MGLLPVTAYHYTYSFTLRYGLSSIAVGLFQDSVRFVMDADFH
jgi:hypothetical protein